MDSRGCRRTRRGGIENQQL